MAAPDVHKLINLRGYGNAEKELRKAGFWNLTPQEYMLGIIDNLNDLAVDIVSQRDAIDHLSKYMENHE